MKTVTKIVTKEKFHNEIRPELKAGGKTIALCHGVFDLIHPGHIEHFKQASEMADVLVVSLTAAEFVRKGPGRPYFSDEQRLSFLEEIECIDYVMLSEGYTVDDIIEAVEPDFYVKGEEYSKPADDITGMITHEEDIVKAHGGSIAFTGGEVFSSTKLINNGLSAIPEEVKEYVIDFKTRHDMKELRDYAEKAMSLKILVIGETIIDRYTYCRVQGLMSKDMAYSAREHSSESFFGGAVAIARHLSSFSNSVTLLSVIGNEPEILSEMNSKFSGRINLNLIQNETVPTIIKQRYLSRHAKREEYRKIFTINNIPEIPGYDESTIKELQARAERIVPEFDAVFICDFGHGMMNQKLMDYLQENAKFVLLNCQTNSSNRGLNIITKYRRADAFAMDQAELSLAEPGYDTDDMQKLEKMSADLSGAAGWLTRGADGAFGIDRNNAIFKVPAFTLTVKDTIGAGDAFYSLAGIYAAAGAPVEVSTFMGNIGGALGANIVGNRESVEKVDALKFANTLLNV